MAHALVSRESRLLTLKPKARPRRPGPASPLCVPLSNYTFKNHPKNVILDLKIKLSGKD